MSLSVTNSSDGNYIRTISGFRQFISKAGIFKPMQGRYHLYISLACPWANRCLALLKMKGLEDSIGVSIVHPTWQRTRPNEEHFGWKFFDYNNNPSNEKIVSHLGFGDFTKAVEHCTSDPINGAGYVRDLYDMANDTTGKYSVPILWDVEKKTIVNNESSEIVRMLNAEFNDFCSSEEGKALDIYPEALRSEIDSVNEWIYPTINNGVYRCGFASTQEAYDTAVDELFKSLDRVELILENNRYLVGNTFTEADLRLFMTLIRFDEVYVVYFKCNVKRISDYHNITNYMRDIYQSFPKLASTIDMDHIKVHYFTSHYKLNHYAIIPKGSGVISDMLKPHNRVDM